jgi:hypothetical protein
MEVSPTASKEGYDNPIPTRSLAPIDCGMKWL